MPVLAVGLADCSPDGDLKRHTGMMVFASGDIPFNLTLLQVNYPAMPVPFSCVAPLHFHEDWKSAKKLFLSQNWSWKEQCIFKLKKQNMAVEIEPLCTV